MPSGSDDAGASADAGSVSEGSYHAQGSAHNSSASPDLINPSTHAVMMEPLLHKLNSNGDTIEKLVNEITVLRVRLYHPHHSLLSIFLNFVQGMFVIAIVMMM